MDFYRKKGRSGALRASLRKLSMEVEFDEGQVGMAEILRRLREMGYQAEEAGGA
jgi:hypothetical protein